MPGLMWREYAASSCSMGTINCPPSLFWSVQHQQIALQTVRELGNAHRDVGGGMPQDTIVVSLGACPDPVKVKFIYVAHLKQRLLTKVVYI